MERAAAFRADQVGSLLRTAPLKEARARHARGEIGAAELRAVEDRESAALVSKQEPAFSQFLEQTRTFLAT